MKRTSHGTGEFREAEFESFGRGVVCEPGVLVFHPETIAIGDHVYIGHHTILKGYYRNTMTIGSGSWIGPQCFLHSAGGLSIGETVGVGPGVKILTSSHGEEGREIPILHSRVELGPVVLEDDCDIGVGAIILPGVVIGRGAQVGAGSVVTRSVEPYSVAVGVPARVIRMRPEFSRGEAPQDQTPEPR